MFKRIRKSILAALCISVGCIVNLMCVDKGFPITGAFLFTLGLYTICSYKFDLFTGKIGYVVENKNYGEVFKILLVNLFFGYLFGLLLSVIVPDSLAQSLINTKLSLSISEILIKGFFCGILMYLAVDGFKNGSPISIFLSVPIFILSGFEHCIANIIYFGMAKNIFFLEFIIFNVVGNTIGSIFISQMISSNKR